MPNTLGNAQNSDDPLGIGCTAGTSNCFDGLLDDIRIYNQTLSEEQISLTCCT